jgi:hypothetical protein
MLSAEDGIAETLQPRLEALEADLDRVFVLKDVLTLDEQGLLRLDDTIVHRKAALVIIDPLFGYTGGRVDINRANECRAILAPLAAMAERQRCAIVAVRHLSKSRGSGHALNAGLGSIDLSAAARSILLAGIDPHDKTKRAMSQSKTNLGVLGESIGYSLDDGKFRWTGASSATAEEILSGTVARQSGPNDQVQEAIEFLKEMLAHGPQPASVVKEEAVTADIGEKTLRTARAKLGIHVSKEGGRNSSGQRWMWSLNGVETPSEEGDDDHPFSLGPDPAPIFVEKPGKKNNPLVDPCGCFESV